MNVHAYMQKKKKNVHAKHFIYGARERERERETERGPMTITSMAAT